MPNRRRFLTHESFARLVAIETDECVLWPHGVSSRGYGAISIENRTRAVHVLACEIAHGPKPSADMQVQGFPADWTWTGTKTQQARMIGNAVPPRLAEVVAANNRPAAQ